MAANPYYSRHDYCKIIVIVILEEEVETFFIHTIVNGTQELEQFCY